MQRRECHRLRLALLPRQLPACGEIERDVEHVHGRAVLAAAVIESVSAFIRPRWPQVAKRNVIAAVESGKRVRAPVSSGARRTKERANGARLPHRVERKGIGVHKTAEEEARETEEGHQQQYAVPVSRFRGPVLGPGDSQAVDQVLDLVDGCRSHGHVGFQRAVRRQRLRNAPQDAAPATLLWRHGERGCGAVRGHSTFTRHNGQVRPVQPEVAYSGMLPKRVLDSGVCVKQPVLVVGIEDTGSPDAVEFDGTHVEHGVRERARPDHDERVVTARPEESAVVGGLGGPETNVVEAVLLVVLGPGIEAGAQQSPRRLDSLPRRVGHDFKQRR